MRFGSLFTGIGGMDIGLERAGMTCAWQVENDRYCRRVLARHWPEVPRYGDVRLLTGKHLPAVDLIAGGFPCQPVSHAGRRHGKADDRWLWDDFARLVGDLRPRYVLVENVPNLRHHGFGTVLGDLAALGYDAEWEHLPAASVGALHIRDRLFLLAYTDRAAVQRAGGTGILGRAPRTLTREALQRRWRGRAPGDSGEAQLAVPDAASLGREQGRPGARAGAGQSRRFRLPAFDYWLSEPPVGRVVNGLPRRVDRLRALGNAVVPQVAEVVGTLIMEFEDERLPISSD
jgi:DNA (cytosine-5)-methyltransferase 1